MQQRPSIFFLFLLLLAASLPWFVAPSTYWRDGPEFIVTAAFLDISHPPGAPLYASAAHPWSWLPIGPLAARIHLFSAASLLLLLSLTYLISRHLLVGPIAATALCFALLFLPGVLHQALTAEVYLLSALLILAMVAALQSYARTQDKRWVFSIALIAGLGSGAHLIVGVIGAAIAAVALIHSRLTLLRFVIPTTLLLLAGLLVWGYLPMRALQTPPLNSGAPATFERFVNQITNARDRDLRPKGGLESFHLSTQQLAEDVQRIAERSGYPLLLAALLGLGVLVIRYPLVGSAIVSSLGVLWALFAGWDFAPFVMVMPLVLLGVGGLLGELVRRGIPRSAMVLPVGIVLLGISGSHAPIVASELRHYERQAAVCSPILSAAAHAARVTDPSDQSDRKGIALIEQSIFCVTYVHQIEGLWNREVATYYQPAAEFPDYFAPLTAPASSAKVSSLNQLLASLPPGLAISFEPSVLTAKRLATIAQCEPARFGLRLFIERSSQGLIDPLCGPYLLNQMTFPESQSPELRADEQHYREMLLLPVAELLSNSGLAEESHNLLDLLCATHRCSERAVAAIATWRASNKG